MTDNRYGYARVSSLDQNQLRQTTELLKCGIPSERIFVDKVSGKDFNRPEYQRLRATLSKGSVLFVKSIDRLGRNYLEIHKEWDYIVNKIGADIVVLDMELLDTRTKKDLVGTLISDIVLGLLAYVAQSERENIRQRQKEGIALAKMAGRNLGRIPRPYPDNFEQLMNEYNEKRIDIHDITHRLGISVNQFRWFRARRKQELKNSRKAQGY